MVFKALLTGFLVKFAASFDDTLTRIPVLSALTKTRKGKIAFSLGTILALTVIIILAIAFSSVLETVPYISQVVAVLIFVLALAVYRGFSISISMGMPGAARLTRLVLIGFVVSLVTFLDDMIVLLPLFLGHGVEKYYRIAGIYLALLVQIGAVIYLSKFIDRLKYKKELAAGALGVLAVLTWFSLI